MRQFHVPQFIDVEDKIFGPLTLKQFLYIIGGAGISFLIYAFLKNFLPLFIIITIAAPVLAFFFALAFYQMNGRPFIVTLESMLNHYTKARLYIWKKVDRPVAVTEEKETFSYVNRLAIPKKTKQQEKTGSRLRDLAWSIDINQQGVRNDELGIKKKE